MKKKSENSSPPLWLWILGSLAGIGVVWIFQTCSQRSLPEAPKETSTSIQQSISSDSSVAPKKEVKVQNSSVPSIKVYKKYLDQVSSKLAKVEDLKKMSAEELHYTPQVILRAASSFVKILEAAKTSDEHYAESKNFFHNCALSEEVATTLRATCLVNERQLFVDHGGKKEDFDLSPYSERIRKLAEGM